MEEVERVAKEKYQALKNHLPEADDETIAILMAINTLSTQLSREIAIEKMEAEILDLRQKPWLVFKKKLIK